ncbi:unnamed protein product [Ceutorhynchus assimilis]|uniref:FLYWCH-type domain-containing protein n=1 Tax=Ceutorhynchus assimilis TaxID=467358 RepID=A0A9P0DDJ2_9CUCU|nr:unnamed protein product [Ceutorhynchus assimilis]
MGRKYPKMIIDGFEFKLYRHTKTSSLWVCTRERYKCKVRLVTTGKQVHMKSISHNHERNFEGSYDGLASQRVTMFYRDDKLHLVNKICLENQ